MGTIANIQPASPVLSPDIISSWQSYSPILKGATDDPAVVYSTQVGRYVLVGSLLYFKINLVTTSITKTTLTDNVRISLPAISANNAGDMAIMSAMIENSTAVLNGNAGEIGPANQYMQFKNLPLATSSAFITYALDSLGVLSNTITFSASGFYEV